MDYYGFIMAEDTKDGKHKVKVSGFYLLIY